MPTDEEEVSLLEALRTPRNDWRWQSRGKGIFRRCQTARLDQNARTPAWLLTHLRDTYGSFFDPAPVDPQPCRQRALHGRRASMAWPPGRSGRPSTTSTRRSNRAPARPRLMDAFLQKGAAEHTYRGCHNIFLIPCAKLHHRYFARVFPTVTHPEWCRGSATRRPQVQVLSRTIAFEGYSRPLPHPLALLHMRAPDAVGDGGNGCRLWLLKVPEPRTFEMLRGMVNDAGYEQCYALDNAVSPALAAVFGGEGPQARGKPVVLVLPSRLENRWFHTHIFPSARAREISHPRGMSPALPACSCAPAACGQAVPQACRGPSAGQRPVWSGTAVVVMDDDDERFRSFVEGSWVSRHSSQIQSLHVPRSARRQPCPAPPPEPRKPDGRVKRHRSPGGAGTPSWLAGHVRTAWATADAAPVEPEGLETPWPRIAFAPSPPQQHLMEAYLQKGSAESTYRGCHCIFFLPCAKLHYRYFERVFLSVSLVEVLSQSGLRCAHRNAGRGRWRLRAIPDPCPTP